MAISRSPLPTVVLHWVFVGGLLISLFTGLRIAADDPAAVVGRALGDVLPQGPVFQWHLLSAVLLTALAIGYGAYLWRAGLAARYTPQKLWRAIAGAGRRGARWSAVSRMLDGLAFGLFLIALTTGVLQYLGVVWLPALVLESLHRWAAWGMVGFAFGHVAGHALAGGLGRLAGIFLPRAVLLKAGAVALAATALVVFALPNLDRSAYLTLPVPFTDAPPRLDGIPEEAAWNAAVPVSIRTHAGANFPGGETTVQVRALHDGRHAYFLFEWDDPTRSQKHLPLVKTAAGWTIAQEAYLRADESVFYEDKLAVLLAHGDPDAARTSIHLGRQPLDGQPGAAHGRGLHYTADGVLLDLWHWQSVRSNPFGQADDGHIGSPKRLPRLPAAAAAGELGHTPYPERYSAGYKKDPPMTWSSYAMNWEDFGEGVIQPRYLPKAEELEEVIDALAGPDLDPSASDGGRWWMDYSDVRYYAPELDDLPVGTILPSVLLQSPLPGDRGQVSALGTWANGRWRVEMKRLLDTGSEYDVALTDETYLWVAAFDHAQTRHTYHLRPLRLRFR